MDKENITLKVKILDSERFKELVDALVVWAEEVCRCEEMTDAESALFSAAIAVADDDSN